MWNQRVDMPIKSKTFKREAPTEFLLPLRYCGRWMLLMWDCAKTTRETLIFEEKAHEINSWVQLQ